MSLITRLTNSRLFKSAMVYGVSSALNGAIPFFLLPILTRYLSPSDYGQITVFTTIISFFNVIIGLNVNVATFNYYFFKKDDPNFNFSSYISNAILILIFSSFITILLVLALQGVLTELTQIPLTWILIAASTPLFQFIIFIQLAIFQAGHKPFHFATLMLLQSASNILFSLLLVAGLHLNWTGRALGISFSLYLCGLISYVVLKKKYQLSLSTFKPNKQQITGLLKFGLPLVPHTLGAVLISLADRLIISKVINLSEAGLYQAGLQISMVLLFFTEAFNKAYSPWLYSSLKADTPGMKVKIVKFTYSYFVFILCMALLIAATPQSLISSVLGETYKDAKQFMFWSSLAFAFNGMYLMVCNYIFYAERTKYLAYITLPSGILNITLSYYLVHKLGAVGACISMCIAYLLMFLFTWYRSAQLVKMPWNLFKKADQ